ncbi:MAG: polymer-forming cytoskeletal protein [Hungatella sp.]|nr:polymer-forming cytoskeletal protein [Hungatella sp.]
MFGSKKKGDTINTSTISTIIGNNSRIEGVLTASESTRIDGVLEGKIMSESSVIVGETGEVVGDITAVEILVAGIVYGNLIAKERIEMTSTGRVLGDLITKTLVIDEGASFKGNCTMEVAGEEKLRTDSLSSASKNPVHTPKADVSAPHTAKEEPAKDNSGQDTKEKNGRNKKEDSHKNGNDQAKTA